MSGWTGRLATAARVLLGLIFTVFGVNGFLLSVFGLNFIPAPPAPPEAATFAAALFEAPYFLPLLKSVEIVAGLLLLSGWLVPFALVLLAPIIVNIVAFHTFLAPDPTMPVVLLTLEISLAWTWRAAFAPLFVSRVPRAQSEEAPAFLSPARTHTPAR